MSAIPSLSTERLTLTGPTSADFAESAAMWGNPEVTRYIGGRPSTEEEVWSRLIRYVGHWAMMGFGYWVVRERSTGVFVGEVGFADWRREIDPPFDGVPEIGWSLSPAAQGKGFASEAARGVCAWGDAKWAGARTVCMIHPDNAPSLSVAERTGYRAYAQAAYKDAPTVLLERLNKHDLKDE